MDWVLSHIWISWALSRVIVFSWQLLLNKFYYRENLFSVRSFWIHMGVCCCFCGALVESESHLFITCQVVLTLWYMIFRWLGWFFVILKDIMSLFEISYLRRVSQSWYDYSLACGGMVYLEVPNFFCFFQVHLLMRSTWKTWALFWPRNVTMGSSWTILTLSLVKWRNISCIWINSDFEYLSSYLGCNLSSPFFLEDYTLKYC